MSLGLVARLKIGNPIFARELLTSLRNPRGFLLLTASLLVSAVAVLSSWPETPEGIVGQGELSRRIFTLFAWAQMLILAFVIPGTLAASITTEKESETIDLLLTTPLSGHMIVSGKLLSGLGYVLLLGLASLPVLMLCSVIGGLSGLDVLRLFAILIMQAVAYGLTCIACSALSARTVMAVMVAYMLVAIEAALFAMARDDLLGTAIRAGLISLPAYFVAVWGARRPYNPVPPPPEERDPRTTAGLVLRRDAFPDRFIMPSRRTADLGVTQNPIHRKELQAGIHGSGSRFVRLLIQLGIFLGLAVFFVVLSRSAETGIESGGSHAGHIFLCFVAAFAMTLGPAIGARAFSGEREEGTAEMLCMALLPRSQIVLGKYTACIRVVTILSAINCVPFLAFALFTLSWFQVVLLVIVLLSVSTTSIAVGFWFSLGAKTTISAMFRTYGLLFVVWIVPALLPRFMQFTPRWLDLVLRVVTPFEACDIALTGARDRYVADLLCLGGHVVLSGLIAAAILYVCSRDFDRYMQKTAEEL